MHLVIAAYYGRLGRLNDRHECTMYQRPSSENLTPYYDYFKGYKYFESESQNEYMTWSTVMQKTLKSNKIK